MNVLTIGTWDLFHAGHVDFLRRCAKLGTLHVGVNTDDYAATFKARPVIPEWERLTVVSECVSANITGLYNGIDGDKECGYSFRSFVKSWGLRGSILAVGNDWASKDYLVHLGITPEDLKSLNLNLIYLPRSPITSSTEIRQRVLDRECQRVMERHS